MKHFECFHTSSNLVTLTMSNDENKLLPPGYHENEFGKLVKKPIKKDIIISPLTKEIFLSAEKQITDLISKRAVDDIMAMEDFIVFDF